MSETQGGGLIREQFLPNATPAQRESSAVTVETEIQRVVNLLMNYVCLMFNLYF